MKQRIKKCSELTKQDYILDNVSYKMPCRNTECGNKNAYVTIDGGLSYEENDYFICATHYNELPDGAQKTPKPTTKLRSLRDIACSLILLDVLNGLNENVFNACLKESIQELQNILDSLDLKKRPN